jgi:hypothetical protein
MSVASFLANSLLLSSRRFTLHFIMRCMQANKQEIGEGILLQKCCEY